MIKMRPSRKRIILIIFTVLVGGMIHAQTNKSAGDRSEFVHPGILHNQAELDFIKQKVQAKEEPWFSGWNALLEAEISSLDWQPKAVSDVLRGAYNKPDIGASDLERDAAAVYSQAIQWVVTADPKHAQKAITILNDWSSTLKFVGEHDAKLLVGMTGVNMINGAEIIRHTSKLWQEHDIARFEKMLLDVHYVVIKDFFDWANGNWDASMIQTMLSIGIFTDRNDIFQRAVDYFLEGKGNGSILNYFNDFGQCQESGRDQSHVQMGIGFLGAACEIAWKQGVDLYGAYDSRMALGFEYTAKYNLGYDVPFEPYSSIDGRYKHTSISEKGRGRLRPIYERAYHHYHDRKGLEMPYTLKAIQKNRPEKWHIQHASWGTLLHANLIGGAPQAEISNGIITANFYLPDAKNGYYRGTRFDWSGIIYNLEYDGHTYFGKWFDEYDPLRHDAIMGPVESFGPLNYREAEVGDTFVKIGVGLLTKPTDERFHGFTTYPVADPGKWKIQKKADQIQFIQEIEDEHYAHEYTKLVRLVKGKSEMIISHVLKNKGDRTIETNVFNHNFFVIDEQPTGPGFEVTFVAGISGTGRGMGELAEIQDNKIVFKRELVNGENIYCSSLEGINDDARLYDIVVENKITKAGVRITGDKPLSKMVFWTSHTTVCPEPYIKIEVEPGQEFTWTYIYAFFTKDAPKK